MKKNIIITLFLALVMSSFASAKDYSQYCSPNSPQKSFSGNLMSLTGANMLSRNIIEKQIENAIKEETNSKFKVKVNNFWGNNIIGGEFKSFSASAKKFQGEDIHLSDVNVETFCPYNRVSYVDEKLLFDENMVLKFSAKMTQEDLNNTLNSSSFKKAIDKMNADKVMSSLLKIENHSATIKNNMLYFKYTILPLPKYDLSFLSKNIIKPLDVVFGAGLEVKNGKIELCDFKLNSFSSNNSKLLPIVNNFNPANFKVDVDKNNQGSLEFDSVKIDNDKILLSGWIVVEKNK